jgi:hypothetical protein
VHGFVPYGSGREPVRRVGWYHQDLPGKGLVAIGADGEHRGAPPDDEGLGIRMLVQARTDAFLGRRLDDDRDVSVSRQLVVVRGPLVAAGPTVGAIDRERRHRGGQPMSPDSAATKEAENDDDKNDDDDDDDEKPHAASI